MKAGRKSTPTADLKIHGTYRRDRHEDRADVTPPSGQPVRPETLDTIEGGLWDQVVPELVRKQMVGESDTAELVCMCELWGLYRNVVAKAKAAPTDKEIRCAVTAYFTAFDRLAAKFGLTSADRAGLKLPSGEKKNSVPTRVRA